jgi:hypothetical protein
MATGGDDGFDKAYKHVRPGRNEWPPVFCGAMVDAVVEATAATSGGAQADAS